MTNDQKAAARFFLRVEQTGTKWADRNTLPLFPLLLVMDAEMLESDAKWEAGKVCTGRRFRAEIVKSPKPVSSIFFRQ